ncbi:MAG: hypothetical protein IPM88_19820 [Nitrospira sp.]|nr:hypothetical protein [Nitrospira sp.]
MPEVSSMESGHPWIAEAFQHGDRRLDITPGDGLGRFNSSCDGFGKKVPKRIGRGGQRPS